MNKILALATVLIVAALVAGIYATSTHEAFASSVTFSQSIKQSASCTGLFTEFSCNNAAANFFDFGG